MHNSIACPTKTISLKPHRITLPINAESILVDIRHGVKYKGFTGVYIQHQTAHHRSVYILAFNTGSILEDIRCGIEGELFEENSPAENTTSNNPHRMHVFVNNLFYNLICQIIHSVTNVNQLHYGLEGGEREIAWERERERERESDR